MLITAKFDTVDSADLAVKALKENGVKVENRRVLRHTATPPVEDAFEYISDFAPVPEAAENSVVAPYGPVPTGGEATTFVPTYAMRAVSDVRSASQEVILELEVPDSELPAASAQLRSLGGYSIR